MALFCVRWLYFMVILLFALASGILHPCADFKANKLVKPKMYNGKEKKQIPNTKENNGYHLDHIQILVEVDSQEITLDLFLSKTLIPKGFFQSHQENGKYVVQKPSIEKVDHCHYHGVVRGEPDSWAAISTCNDAVSGTVFDGMDLHYIEKDAFSPDVHFWYKHSEISVNNNRTCGHAEDDKLALISRTTDNQFKRYKRSINELPALIRGPYNSNKYSRYVELVLVVDNSEYKALGESIAIAIDRCKRIVNIVNALYSPLNVFVALIGVVIWTEHDEISMSSDSFLTLDNFLVYRQTKLLQKHPNDHAQMLTNFTFDKGVIGKAYMGMCTHKYSGGLVRDDVSMTGLVATTMAHEMGHSLGMKHDQENCHCPNKTCIMSPSIFSPDIVNWSSCSIYDLFLGYTYGLDFCLKNKPESLLAYPVCGNGFVEPREECDCGLQDYCENPCCDARACMMFSNASCATGECCDLKTCKPKTAGTLCRSAYYECDLPEYCTGQSEFCPPDIFKLDAETCDRGKAFCYQGFCRSRDDQCRLLWGPSGKSSDDLCYRENNVNGNGNGNCGYNKIDKSYEKCQKQDVLCGMLQCKHLVNGSNLQFGLLSAALLSQSYMVQNGTVFLCQSANIDVSSSGSSDPGMTPDGAKCGETKICVNRRCIDVSSLRRSNPSCEKGCNGNGWCNNKGHCHCRKGYAPPYCNNPGPGGSEESGPASDPNAFQGVVTALLVIFVGVIPCIAVVAIILYSVKYTDTQSHKKLSTSMSRYQQYEYLKSFCECQTTNSDEKNMN